MKRVELLSPAGNMECLIGAVQNGADAVYLGGKKFGARAFANNFDYEELIEAIKYCHLYGVKIYVTVNTICYENEIEEALDYIDFLYNNHVDALIMQDLGLISLVREKYPNLEVHASTQMHNHNDYGLSYLKSIGIKRAVLDREMSLENIKSLKTDIEKEVFIHGALCVSFSGCCLFSAMHGGRSGNRGECVGSCRLPYNLLENGEELDTDGRYIMSTKSLCTINNIDKLIDAGITSFKIEGRMKSKEYVSYITRLYREKIDSYYLSKKYNVSEEEIENIKKLYNRELTSGYLFNKYGDELMNIKSSNHIGVHLGSVIKVDKKKIYIKLDQDLNQEDGIRFDNDKGMIVNKLYNEKDLLVNKVDKGKVAVIDNKIGLLKAKEVRKTLDIKLVEEINKPKERKVPVTLKCVAKLGQYLEISVSDGINNIKETGNIVEKANTSPMHYERIKTQIEKLGNTVFTAKDTEIEMDDNIFISIKELNDLRRNILDKLKEKREYSSPYKVVINDLDTTYDESLSKKLKISILVRNEEQLNVAIDNKVDYIYVTDYDLYKKYKNKNIYYRTNRVTTNSQDYINENLLVTELGGIYKYSKNNNVISDYYLNVVNNSTINTLLKIGADRVVLSPEINMDNIRLLKNNKYIDLLVYGRIELMITKYCPMNMIINKDNKKCNLCKINKYSLKDIDNNIYPLEPDNTHIVHILDNKNYNLLDNLESLIDYGISSFRVELYDESKEEIEKIIKKIRNSYELGNNK